MTIRNTEKAGPLDLKYELHTNDPRNPVIKLSLAANLKPLPDYIKRIANADKTHGEQSGPFKIWPTARPTLTLEPGERLGFSLRIRPAAGRAIPLNLKSASSDRVKYNLRPEAQGGGYWLDIEAGPVTGSLTEKVVLAASLEDGTTSEVVVRLTIKLPERNIVFTPETVDLGEASLQDLKMGSRRAGRVGIRKLAGAFQIKSLTSTLAFLQLEKQTIVEGSNYLVRVTLDSTRLPKPGPHTGVIRIETDDTHTPVVEIPVKITLAK